jgi:ankyrin repeat protein
MRQHALLLATDGVDPDSKDKDGRTPLLLAAANGHEAVMKKLLAKDGVDPNSKDDDGQTGLSNGAPPLVGHYA